MTRRTHLLLPALLLLPLLLAGCSLSARWGILGVQANTEPAPSAGIRIRVHNFNSSDATLHVVGGGGRYMGRVRTKTSESYDVGWPEEEALRFRVHPADGGRCRTSIVTAVPGETIRLEIEEPLIHSKPSCR